jgi:tetratricopeptide (TPR) repeat protein/DNA-binding CsgD family transcriptional regulator
MSEIHSIEEKIPTVKKEEVDQKGAAKELVSQTPVTVIEQLKELVNTIIILSKQVTQDKDAEFIRAAESFDSLSNSIKEFDHQYYTLLQRRHLAEGDYNRFRDKHANAIRSFKYALNLYDSQNKETYYYSVLAGTRLAHEYRNIGLYNEALEVLKHAYDIALMLDNRKTLGDILDTMGTVFYDMGDLHKSLEYHKISLEISEEIQSYEDIAYSYNNLASTYQSLGEYELSITLYLQSIEIKERLNDTRGISASLNNIGNSLVYLGRFSEAEEYFKRSLEIKRTFQRPGLLATSLMGLATVYSKQNKAQEVQAVFEEMLNIISVCESESVILLLKRHIAEILAEQGDYEKAYNYLLDSYQLNEAQRGEQIQKRFTNLMAVFEVSRHEQEATIQKMKAEQLQKDLDAKNSELTAMALNLVQKNEVLQQLKERIEKNDKPNKTNTDNILQTIRKEINSSLADDKAWKRFEEQFNLVHGEFLRTVARLHPSLSPVELRICALLKINLSSKEIASMLCIEAKTVEVYRYRIRQKIKLGQGTNLVQHLMSF